LLVCLIECTFCEPLNCSRSEGFFFRSTTALAPETSPTSGLGFQLVPRPPVSNNNHPVQAYSDMEGSRKPQWFGLRAAFGPTAEEGNVVQLRVSGARCCRCTLLNKSGRTSSAVSHRQFIFQPHHRCAPCCLDRPLAPFMRCSELQTDSWGRTYCMIIANTQIDGVAPCGFKVQRIAGMN
jgi:hypothetical protein